MTTIIEASLYRDGGSLSLTMLNDGNYYTIWIQYNWDSRDHERPTMRRGRGTKGEEMFELTWEELYNTIQNASVDFTLCPLYSNVQKLIADPDSNTTFQQRDLDDFVWHYEHAFACVKELLTEKTRF